MNKKDLFEKYASKETFEKIVEVKTVQELTKLMKDNYLDIDAIQTKDLKFKTYKELLSDVKKVYTLLASKEIKKGDIVGVYAGNNVDFAVSALGIMSYGAVAALIPSQLPKEIMPGVEKKYNLSLLLYEDELTENASLVANKYNIKDIYTLDEGKTTIKVKPEDPCCIVMTGGTTGQSKGALLSHKNVMVGVINGCYGIDTVFNQKYYSIMPLTHVFGLIRNLLTCFYTGSTIAFNYSKPNMFKDIQTFSPSVLVLVPALVELLLNITKQFGPQMLGSNLKLIIAGGAAVPQYLIEEFDKLGILVCPGYGLTELANMVSGNPIPLEKPNSVGLIFPGLEAKLVNDELYLKGDNLMIEYFNNPEENAIAFEDGWFKTGDLAKIDEDGFLYITGRSKDIIVLPNGENISPADLENKFNAIKYIQDSLVYEKDGKLVLEVLPRASELKKDAVEDTPKTLHEEIEKVNKELPDFSKINEIVIRDKDFDRSPSMKIIRPRG